MADETQPPAGVPEADVEVRTRRVSTLWLVPLVALAIAVWLAYTTIAQKGPTITIRFETAEGLEAQKTKVKHKNVDIGLVDGVALSEDLSHIVVTATMDREAGRLLTEGTRFWVVRPRLSASGVSGLGTLVSGSYIEMDPGSGEPARTFEGLETPPVIRSNVPGREFILTSRELGSIGRGSQISFRGLPVGEVLGYELSPNRQELTILIFVKEPYDALVREGTRFWNASGIEMSLGASGVSLRTESLQAILTGGVAFETPIEAMGEPPSPEQAVFPLFPSYASISESRYTRKVRYVLYFDGSVGGLSTGSPVEFRGIKVGSVLDVRLEYDMTESTLRIPVLIEIERDRIEILHGTDGDLEARIARDQMIDRGMRAQLRPGNLLTGQLTVALDFFPDAPPARITLAKDGTPILPTVPSQLDELTRTVSGLLDKVASLPLDQIAGDLRNTLERIDQLLRSPALDNAVASLNEVGPILLGARKTIEAADKTLAQAEATLATAQTTVEENADLRQEFVDLLRELKTTARAVGQLADYLERHPEALLQGKTGAGKQ